jgi:hypothetical protein
VSKSSAMAVLQGCRPWYARVAPCQRIHITRTSGTGASGTRGRDSPMGESLRWIASLLWSPLCGLLWACTWPGCFTASRPVPWSAGTFGFGICPTSLEGWGSPIALETPVEYEEATSHPHSPSAGPGRPCCPKVPSRSSYHASAPAGRSLGCIQGRYDYRSALPPH